MGSRSQHSGGKSYGAPIGGTPKPGGTTRKRPKVGDKDQNYKPGKKRPAPPTSSKPQPPKQNGEGSVFRDYRGVEGILEDAEKGKKRKK